mmetsp:Transcript_23011/g.53777  ORF Transcript_23011/g.53777 Transcript_23011/m.53777 type:complete len:267 (+) Transcript_23011:5109-5909(+)
MGLPRPLCLRLRRNAFRRRLGGTERVTSGAGGRSLWLRWSLSCRRLETRRRARLRSRCLCRRRGWWRSRLTLTRQLPSRPPPAKSIVASPSPCLQPPLRKKTPAQSSMPSARLPHPAPPRPPPPTARGTPPAPRTRSLPSGSRPPPCPPPSRRPRPSRPRPTPPSSPRPAVSRSTPRRCRPSAASRSLTRPRPSSPQTALCPRRPSTPRQLCAFPSLRRRRVSRLEPPRRCHLRRRPAPLPGTSPRRRRTLRGRTGGRLATGSLVS